MPTAGPAYRPRQDRQGLCTKGKGDRKFTIPSRLNYKNQIQCFLPTRQISFYCPDWDAKCLQFTLPSHCLHHKEDQGHPRKQLLLIFFLCPTHWKGKGSSSAASPAARPSDFLLWQSCLRGTVEAEDVYFFSAPLEWVRGQRSLLGFSTKRWEGEKNDFPLSSIQTYST